MSVRKSKKGHRTISFAPYGRIPLRDAKDSVTFTLAQNDVKNGKKNAPTGCAIALCAKRFSVDGIEGAIPGFLAIQVRKTATLVAKSAKMGIFCERYVHSPLLTQLINGFDSDSAKRLRAGDTVTLTAPRGYRRIGKSNGTTGSGSHVALNPRVRKTCIRRGVYLDDVHATAAKHDKTLSILV